MLLHDKRFWWRISKKYAGVNPWTIYGYRQDSKKNQISDTKIKIKNKQF